MRSDGKVSADSLSISGNPTDDEIAAIAAAYAFLLARTSGSPDNSFRQLLWHKAKRIDPSERSLITQQFRTWTNAHRLLSR